MKNLPAKIILAMFFVLPLLLAAVALRFNLLTALVFTIIIGALLMPRQPVCMDATLILPLFLKKVMEAYKSRLPAMSYFSWDLGLNAQAVKYEQEIIAQMPQIPAAADHVPGNDLTAGAQNVKDLITDVKMKIDRCKKVVLKVPTADAVRLELDTTFQEALANCGYALAEAVVNEALSFVNPDTFSHEIVEAEAEVDKSTLSRGRVQLNLQKAGDRRFGLAGSEFMSSLTNDPRIASGDYYGQQVDGNPYVTLRNIEGFQAISEFAQFPADDNLLAFFFDTRALLIAVRQMIDTLNMARALNIPVPILDMTRRDPQTGVSMTAYMWIDVKTHDIYVAFVVMFGLSGGRLNLNAEGAQEAGAADSALDRSGLRVVSEATA